MVVLALTRMRLERAGPGMDARGDRAAGMDARDRFRGRRCARMTLSVVGGSRRVSRCGPRGRSLGDPFAAGFALRAVGTCIARVFVWRFLRVVFLVAWQCFAFGVFCFVRGACASILCGACCFARLLVAGGGVRSRVTG